MKKFGLTGYPLEHSFSAGYFADKFRELGITDCRYDNYPIENIELINDLLETESELVGLNVTIPYKEQVIPFLTDLHSDAREIGAVNTIKITRAEGVVKTVGFNTDVYGFEQPLKPLLKAHHKKALILGTGGAAKAVEWVLRKNGIESLFVSRTPQNKQTISYDHVSAETIAKHKLIINTSPIGMHPNTNGCPNLPYCSLTTDHILYDLIYNPQETRFLKKGKQKKATVINGLPMLYVQAEKAWQIWNLPD